MFFIFPKKNSIVISGFTILTITALFILSNQALGYEISPMPELDDLPSFVTPTKLRQSQKDLPTSVTLIRSSDLKKLGIKTVPESLRLVSGMFVGSASGNDYRISYHGTSSQAPRRMQVLIDGVSVYQPGFARIDWSNLPISFDDIKEIEIIKSPNSASYGPNSFFAVVNIKSIDPIDDGGSYLSIRAGDYGVRRSFAKLASSNENSSFRLSVESDRHDGYEENIFGEERHDGLSNKKLSFDIVNELSRKTTARYYNRYVEGITDKEYIDSSQQDFPDTDVEYYTSALVIDHQSSPLSSLQFSAYYSFFDQQEDWESCFPAILLSPSLANLFSLNQDYANAILRQQPYSSDVAAENQLALSVQSDAVRLGDQLLDEVCGDFNNDNKQTNLFMDLQSTHVLHDNIRAVFGVNYSKVSSESDTYFDGEYNYESFTVYSHSEFRPSDLLTFNLGALVENDYERDLNWSPRASVNFHVTDNTSLRIGHSRATRSPDILERDAKWQYRMDNANPGFFDGQEIYYQNSTSESDLVHEKISSTEIGFLHYAMKRKLFVDFKVFYDELEDLISERLLLYDFEPTNNTTGILTGSEIDVSFVPFEYSTARLSYAYLDNNIDNDQERIMYSRHSGSAYLIYSPSWFTSFSYYGADNLAGYWYGSIGFTIGNYYKFSDALVKGAINIKHSLNKDGLVDYGSSSSFPWANINNDPNVVTFEIEIEM